MGRNTVKYLSLLTQIGLTIVIAVGAGAYVGSLLDRWLGTRAVFTIILLVLGAAGGMWSVLQMVNQLANKDNTDDEDQ